jgi:hypothetical protein
LRAFYPSSLIFHPFFFILSILSIRVNFRLSGCRRKADAADAATLKALDGEARAVVLD